MNPKTENKFEILSEKVSDDFLKYWSNLNMMMNEYQLNNSNDWRLACQGVLYNLN